MNIVQFCSVLYISLVRHHSKIANNKTIDDRTFHIESAFPLQTYHAANNGFKWFFFLELMLWKEFDAFFAVHSFFFFLLLSLWAVVCRLNTIYCYFGIFYIRYSLIQNLMSYHYKHFLVCFIVHCISLVWSKVKRNFGMFFSLPQPKNVAFEAFEGVKLDIRHETLTYIPRIIKQEQWK